MDAALRDRLAALCTEGWKIFERFSIEVREREFHPFVAADYDAVLEALLPRCRPASASWNGGRRGA